MFVCYVGCGCYWWERQWEQKENMRLDTVAKALPWSLCSEETYEPSVIPPAVSQQQRFRGGADAQSLSGYISIELPLDIDMSFEAIQPPCINVSGVRSALNTGLCLSHLKKTNPPAWQFFFPRFCILLLLSPLVVHLVVPPTISWSIQIELFAQKNPCDFA